MRLSRAALETVTTCDVRLGGDVIAHLDERDVGPDFHHFAAQFMADNPRGLDAAVGPRIPIVNVGIGSTERGGGDADDSISRARFRIRPVGGGQPWLCRRLDERTHGPIVYHRLNPGKLFWHASLVYLVSPVDLVHPVSFVQPNKQHKPNRPNEQDRLVDFFSFLLEKNGLRQGSQDR